MAPGEVCVGSGPEVAEARHLCVPVSQQRRQGLFLAFLSRGVCHPRPLPCVRRFCWAVAKQGQRSCSPAIGNSPAKMRAWLHVPSWATLAFGQVTVPCASGPDV